MYGNYEAHLVIILNPWSSDDLRLCPFEVFSITIAQLAFVSIWAVDNNV